MFSFRPVNGTSLIFLPVGFYSHLVYDSNVEIHCVFSPTSLIQVIYNSNSLCLILTSVYLSMQGVDVIAAPVNISFLQVK